MTFPTSSESENVEYDVIISADEALATLMNLTDNITSFDEKVVAVQNALLQLGAQGSESLDVLLQKVVALDQAFAGKTGTSALFGTEGMAGWTAVSKGINDVTDSLYPLEAQSVSAGESFSGLMTNSETLNESLDKIPAESEAAAGGFNIMRTALGVLEAMFIFNMIQAVTTFFTNAINYANEYYQALLNISVAQDAMARAGINTTQQDLLNTAKDLEQTWGVFANKDMVNAVAQAGMLGSQFGFTQEQIGQIVNMAAALSIQQGNIANLGTNVEQIIRSIESGSVPAALKEWGVGFDANAVKAEAIRLGLVKEGQTLSDNAKAIATESLLWQQMADRVQKMGEYQNTVAGGADKLKSTWDTLLQTFGQAFSPVIDLLNKVLTLIAQIDTMWIKVWGDDVTKYLSQAIAAALVFEGILDGQVKSLALLPQYWEAATSAVQKYFQQLQQTGGVSTSNTPVNPLAPSPSMTDTKALTNTQMDAAAKDFQNYHDQLVKDTENYNRQIQDLTDQYNLNVRKEIENYDKSVAQEKQNFRLKEIQAEEAYQQKIREINQTYQFDLEDALRKRDALAVIKLMEKHQNELTTAQQQEQLRLQQDQQAEKVRLQQLKQDEQLRLQQLTEEYNLTKQKDAQHYQQQIQDLKTSLDQKLQEEAVSIGQEYGLNQNGINALYTLFKEYYGADGTFAQLQNESYIQMINQSTQFVEAMQKIINQYANTVAQMSSIISGHSAGGLSSGGFIGGESKTNRTTGGGQRYAQGGIALAQSATSAVFGEAGPELAMFLPLNGNPSSMSMSGLGGLGASAQGAIQILLSLDPDLEARIMNNTLNQAANVIVQTYGSR